MKLSKKVFAFLCAMVMALSFGCTTYAAPTEAGNFHLVLNGQNVSFADSKPLNVGGSTMLPFRFLFNLINADGSGKLAWLASEQKVTMTYKGTSVVLWIGNSTASVNAKDVKIDGPAPLIYNGSTYVPFRFIADAFDLYIYWDAATSTAYAAGNAQIGQMESVLASPKATLAGHSLTADASISADMKSLAKGTSLPSLSITGKIEQDRSKPYQHTSLTTKYLFISSTTDTYDDGQNTYTVSNGKTSKSASTFANTGMFANDIMQLAVLDGSNANSLSMFGMKEVDGKYILSGQIYLPASMVASIGNVINSVGGAAVAGMQSKISGPANYRIIIDKASGALEEISAITNLTMSGSGSTPGGIAATYTASFENILLDVPVSATVPAV